MEMKPSAWILGCLDAWMPVCRPGKGIKSLVHDLIQPVEHPFTQPDSHWHLSECG